MKILTDPRKYKRYLSNFDGVLALDLDYNEPLQLIEVGVS